MIPIIQIENGDIPIQRGYAVSMVVRSFKGRRDVEVHLFRPKWQDSDESEINWENLFGGPVSLDAIPDEKKDRKIILEAFTVAERDQVIDYLKEHYSSRLDSILSTPLDFPVPTGLPPLSSMTEGKDIGLIKFEKVPHFDLPFALRGLYNLGAHRPLVETREGDDN
ncbi:hypothetical protein [Maridesulfovibrio hydrothermalis]|uniref:Uncharacterized protein n=1 Tax=Maridesulfovibrio hydrothermalis AM13 = DSM 14728 TaxID=1121451 RepID=L0RGB7_9BACT|nr:hypothetical protein [Maridesulfovibrio hydrothermalis]CCO24611.1 conserved protein of unknown function [Maridesulfovibrio hydrothermalis AM13 = DSM 14728]